MAQSPIIQERHRRDSSGTYPGTGNGTVAPSTRTWLIVAFALGIPFSLVTFWAAMTNNWLVLGPVMVLMAVCEIAVFIWQRNSD